jgi:hypothetical protein
MRLSTTLIGCTKSSAGRGSNTCLHHQYIGRGVRQSRGVGEPTHLWRPCNTHDLTGIGAPATAVLAAFLAAWDQGHAANLGRPAGARTQRGLDQGDLSQKQLRLLREVLAV